MPRYRGGRADPESDHPLRQLLGKMALETATAKLAAMKAHCDGWAAVRIAADDPETEQQRTDQLHREHLP